VVTHVVVVVVYDFIVFMVVIVYSSGKQPVFTLCFDYTGCALKYGFT